MSSVPRIVSWFRSWAYLGSNPLTLIGAVLTTSSAITVISFWFFGILVGGVTQPYLGVIFFLILPGVFVLGLLLMPVGVLLRRRHLTATGAIPAAYPAVDFANPLLRQAFGWFAGLTSLNLIILGVATYRGVEYMDSANFCGQTCHVVMQPEFVAYQNSPHQRVACVECHIGPGAGWFARSKLSGLRQVYAVTFHTYDRPIPSPVEQLRPARETCEQCHWPQVFDGDKLVVRTKYKDDEKNTPQITVLLLKIGGHTAEGSVGIHGRHLEAQSRIEYVATDRQRQTISQVAYLDDSGKSVTFATSDAKAGVGERRTMDCIDCHNRPTHIFQLPEPAVDQAIANGLISRDLPYIKKKAVETLKVNYPDSDTADKRIASALEDFYRSSYPDVYQQRKADIDAAISQVQAMWARNVFPAMNVTWGTYPNNLGHDDFPGCFRCHDGNHTAADGRVITNDCNACHTLLAVDDEHPKILADLAGQ